MTWLRRSVQCCCDVLQTECCSNACVDCYIISWPDMTLALHYEIYHITQHIHVSAGSIVVHRLTNAPCRWSALTGVEVDVQWEGGQGGTGTVLGGVWCDILWRAGLFITVPGFSPGSNPIQLNPGRRSSDPPAEGSCPDTAEMPLDGSSPGGSVTGCPTLTIASDPGCEPPGELEIGACCEPDGNCIQTTLGFCTSIHGEFQGVGTTCEETDCDEPPPDVTGACCLKNQPCQDLTLADCIAIGGRWLGGGFGCGSTPADPCGRDEIPPGYGACCWISDGVIHCEYTSEAQCNAIPGHFNGAGSSCLENVICDIIESPSSQEEIDNYRSGTKYRLPDGSVWSVP